MEYTLVKLYVLAALVIILPVAAKVWRFYMLQKLNVKKQKNGAIETQKITKQMELDDLLNYKQIEPYTKKAKDLFHDLMKAGELSHEQILYINKLIDRCLGIYAQDYKKHKYKNDCHSIYSKLRSTHLSISNLQEIIHVLELFTNDVVMEGQL